MKVYIDLCMDMCMDVCVLSTDIDMCCEPSGKEAGGIMGPPP